MQTCTPFCEKLKAILLKDNLFPSHADLKAHLPFSSEKSECHLGTWSDLQQREYCSFCQLVVTAVSSHDIDDVPGDQEISVLIFPGEQSFRLSYPSRLGLRLAFVAEDEKYVVGPDTARPVREENIQTGLIEKWMKVCDEEHGVCWPKPVEVDPIYAHILRNSNPKVQTNFRVLDLELGCVTPADLEDCKYVTLSYVWGDLPSFRLNGKNFEQLSVEGGLEGIRKELPKTINDAIHFTKAVGQRYLWVDALCLVQDDAEDVREGVEMMNKIYSGSYFTIVAGSGIDASAGLPGTCQTPRSTSRIKTTKEFAPGIKMTILQSIDHHLSNSIYNTRGWTMQEQLLPRRTLIFINGQVHFRCQEANWTEESWSDKYTHYLDPDDSNISRIPTSEGGIGDADGMKGVLQAIWAYQKIFEENSRRILRNEGDALRAVTGILGPLKKGMRSSMVEGVPGSYLDHFLLFSSINGNLRRREGFASFSWAGWEGGIIWPRENFTWPGDEQMWKTGNIWNYLEHNGLVDFESLDPERGVFGQYNVTYSSNPDRLYKLMWEYPGVFANTDISLGKNFNYWKWTDPGKHDEIPAWNSIYSEFSGYRSEDITERIMDSMEKVSIRKDRVEEGRGEFEKLKKEIVGAKLSRKYSNMLAARDLRAFKRLDLYAWESKPDRGNSRFRKPQSRIESSRPTPSTKRPSEDCRLMCAQKWKETHDPDFEIPTFPPYALLHFSAISLLLTLGTTPPTTPQTQKTKNADFDRLPGIPLFSKTGKLVGSLHPDNTALLQAATKSGQGNLIECIIISRCNTPLPESALFTLEDGKDEGSWKIFWVLHVIWRDGIAERRGVGQVLCEAVEGGCGEGAEKKLVLLG